MSRRKTPLEKWQEERRAKAVGLAEQRNTRSAAEHPLFAAMGALEELGPPCTPEEILAEWDRQEVRPTAAGDEFRRRASHFRAICARELDDPELLEIMDHRLRTTLPPTPEHAAEYWRREAQKFLAPGNRAAGTRTKGR